MKDNSEEKQGKEKQVYEEPRVITTYKKEDLEEIIKPHGEYDSGGGCGCGGGSILQNQNNSGLDSMELKISEGKIDLPLPPRFAGTAMAYYRALQTQMPTLLPRG